MCLEIKNDAMRVWLESQIRMVTAWRDDAANASDVDPETLRRLETHLAWLTFEAKRLTRDVRQAA